MKALLPWYCRIVGYVVLLVSVFAPFLLKIYDVITDDNLLFYKEIIKVAMLIGLLMILLAYTKDENEETGRIRIRAMRNAFILTFIYMLSNMIYRLYIGEAELIDTSMIIFMVMNVLCLEYGIKKTAIDKMFKK